MMEFIDRHLEIFSALIELRVFFFYKTEFLLTLVWVNMVVHYTEDDETLDNNNCPYNPLPNRNHIAHPAPQRHFHKSIVEVLLSE